MPDPVQTPGAAEQPAAGASQASSAPSPGPGVDESPPRGSVIDSLGDLVQLFVDYVRQETEGVVHDKVVLPTQKAGQVVAFALAAAMTLFLGVAFVAVASLMLLAYFVGWIAALYIVGALLMAGAAGFTYAKMRKMTP